MRDLYDYDPLLINLKINTPQYPAALNNTLASFLHFKLQNVKHRNTVSFVMICDIT